MSSFLFPRVKKYNIQKALENDHMVGGSINDGIIRKLKFKYKSKPGIKLID